MSQIAEIECVGSWDQINPENDNADIHVRLKDGRVYSFLVATPNNIFWCMANEDIDYYFGFPTLFVRLLNKECVEKALEAILTVEGGRWWNIYGVLEEGEEEE